MFIILVSNSPLPKGPVVNERDSECLVCLSLQSNNDKITSDHQQSKKYNFLSQFHMIEQRKNLFYLLKNK